MIDIFMLILLLAVLVIAGSVMIVEIIQSENKSHRQWTATIFLLVLTFIVCTVLTLTIKFYTICQIQI